MSQLTIYLDEKAMQEVKTAAKRDKLSVSRWARAKLTEAAHRSWPKGYFDLFGSLADADFSRPPQGEPSADIEREQL